MSKLHTLDVSLNPELSELPCELSTCLSLVHIIFTMQTIEEPPQSVTERGTRAILTYLSGDVSAALEIEDQNDNNPAYVLNQSGKDVEPKQYFVESSPVGLEASYAIVISI